MLLKPYDILKYAINFRPDYIYGLNKGETITDEQSNRIDLLFNMFCRHIPLIDLDSFTFDKLKEPFNLSINGTKELFYLNDQYIVSYLMQCHYTINEYLYIDKTKLINIIDLSDPDVIHKWEALMTNIYANNVKDVINKLKTITMVLSSIEFNNTNESNYFKATIVSYFITAIEYFLFIVKLDQCANSVDLSDELRSMFPNFISDRVTRSKIGVVVEKNYFTTEAFEEDENTLDMQEEAEDKYKKLTNSIHSHYKRSLKMFDYQVKHNHRAIAFFKKYLGRIDHLFEDYGDEARLTENKMIDDPTVILQTNGIEYILRLCNEIVQLTKEVMDISKKIGGAQDYKTVFAALKHYLKKYPLDEIDDPEKGLKERILKETRFRIASSLLQDNRVYGYTPKGISMNGKFPPPNYIVVAMFVRNPHEQPQEVAVPEIFKEANSISIFGEKDFPKLYFRLYSQAYNTIIGTLNISTLRSIRAMSHGLTKKVYNSVSKITQDKTKVRQALRVTKVAEQLLDEAMFLIYEQKRRILATIEIMLKMTTRISNLAQEAVLSMLEVEKKHRDNSFNTGFKSVKESDHLDVRTRGRFANSQSGEPQSDEDVVEQKRKDIMKKQLQNSMRHSW